MSAGLFRFEEKNRIKGKKRIQEIFKKGQRVKTSLFDIVFFKKNDGNRSIAVITSSKIGNAVERNRIRRRIKEIFRLNILLYCGAFDLLVIPKKEAAVSKFEELMREYKTCLLNSGLLQKK